MVEERRLTDLLEDAQTRCRNASSVLLKFAAICSNEAVIRTPEKRELATSLLFTLIQQLPDPQELHDIQQSIDRLSPDRVAPVGLNGYRDLPSSATPQPSLPHVSMEPLTPTVVSTMSAPKEPVVRKRDAFGTKYRVLNVDQVIEDLDRVCTPEAHVALQNDLASPTLMDEPVAVEECSRAASAQSSVRKSPADIGLDSNLSIEDMFDSRLRLGPSSFLSPSLVASSPAPLQSPVSATEPTSSPFILEAKQPTVSSTVLQPIQSTANRGADATPNAAIASFASSQSQSKSIEPISELFSFMSKPPQIDDTPQSTAEKPMSQLQKDPFDFLAKSDSSKVKQPVSSTVKQPDLGSVADMFDDGPAAPHQRAIHNNNDMSESMLLQLVQSIEQSSTHTAAESAIRRPESITTTRAASAQLTNETSTPPMQVSKFTELLQDGITTDLKAMSMGQQSVSVAWGTTGLPATTSDPQQLAASTNYTCPAAETTNSNIIDVVRTNTNTIVESTIANCTAEASTNSNSVDAASTNSNSAATAENTSTIPPTESATAMANEICIAAMTYSVTANVPDNLSVCENLILRAFCQRAPDPRPWPMNPTVYDGYVIKSDDPALSPSNFWFQPHITVVNLIIQIISDIQHLTPCVKETPSPGTYVLAPFAQGGTVAYYRAMVLGHANDAIGTWIHILFIDYGNVDWILLCQHGENYNLKELPVEVREEEYSWQAIRCILRNLAPKTGKAWTAEECRIFRDCCSSQQFITKSTVEGKDEDTCFLRPCSSPEGLFNLVEISRNKQTEDTLEFNSEWINLLAKRGCGRIVREEEFEFFYKSEGDAVECVPPPHNARQPYQLSGLLANPQSPYSSPVSFAHNTSSSSGQQWPSVSTGNAAIEDEQLREAIRRSMDDARATGWSVQGEEANIQATIQQIEEMEDEPIAVTLAPRSLPQKEIPSLFDDLTTPSSPSTRPTLDLPAVNRMVTHSLGIRRRSNSDERVNECESPRPLETSGSDSQLDRVGHTRSPVRSPQPPSIRVPARDLSGMTDTINAVVVAMENPSAFYVHIAGEDTHTLLCKLAADMEAYYKVGSAGDSLRQGTLEPGMQVVCRFAPTQPLTRCRIERIVGPAEIELQCVDSGRRQVMPVTAEIFRLEERFAQLPAQAILCRISDCVSTDTDGHQQSVWSSAACNLFRKILGSVSGPIPALVTFADSSMLHVWLIDAQTGCSISERLVEKGFARLV